MLLTVVRQISRMSEFAGEGGEGAEQLDATELAKQLQKAIDTGEFKVEH